MSLRPRIAGIVGGTLLLALTSPPAGLAWFSGAGAGSSSASVGTLQASSITSAVAGAGTVVLAWSAVAPPVSGATVTYSVARDGGAPSGGCPGDAAPSAATGCTDSGLTAGTYRYTVTAHWRSWTSTSAAVAVAVASGQLDHFLLGAATTTPAAGQPDALTVTAKDAQGNTDVTYTGAHALTFTGASSIGSFVPTVSDGSGTAVPFGTAETISFAAGVATTSGPANGVMTLYRAGSTNVTVGDGTRTGSLAVVVAPAAAASFLAVAPGTATAGTAFALSLTAMDAYGNTATGYAGARTIDFSGPHASPNGTAPLYPASVTFAAGAATAGVTLYAAETTALTATDRGTTVAGTSGSLTVAPAAAATVTATSGGGQSAQVNTAFASPLAVRVTDLYGNAKPGATVTFTAPASGASATFLAASGACSSNGSAAASCSAVTDAGGLAVSSAFAANGSAGGYTIAASVAGATAAAFAETNTGGLAVYQGAGATQAWSGTGAKTVALPAGVQASDLLVLIVSAAVDNGATTDVTVPAGWTKQAFVGTAVAGNHDVQLHVFTKTAGSSEAAPSVTVTATAAQPATARIVGYREAGGTPSWDTAAPANARGTLTTGAATVTPTSITTSVANETAVSIVAQRTSATFTLSAAQSFSLQYQSQSGSVTAGLADRAVSAAGSVAEPTWSSSASGVNWVFVSGAIRP